MIWTQVTQVIPIDDLWVTACVHSRLCQTDSVPRFGFLRLIINVINVSVFYMHVSIKGVGFQPVCDLCIYLIPLVSVCLSHGSMDYINTGLHWSVGVGGCMYYQSSTGAPWFTTDPDTDLNNLTLLIKAVWKDPPPHVILYPSIVHFYVNGWMEL